MFMGAVTTLVNIMKSSYRMFVLSTGIKFVLKPAAVVS